MYIYGHHSSQFNQLSSSTCNHYCKRCRWIRFIFLCEFNHSLDYLSIKWLLPIFSLPFLTSNYEWTSNCSENLFIQKFTSVVLNFPKVNEVDHQIFFFYSRDSLTRNKVVLMPSSLNLFFYNYRIFLCIFEVTYSKF